MVLAIDLPSPSLVLATQTMDWMAKSGEMTFFAISMEAMWAAGEISDDPPWNHHLRWLLRWPAAKASRMPRSPWRPPNGSKWIYTFEIF